MTKARSRTTMASSMTREDVGNVQYASSPATQLQASSTNRRPHGSSYRHLERSSGPIRYGEGDLLRVTGRDRVACPCVPLEDIDITAKHRHVRRYTFS